jgi:hypothetical protein
MKMMRRLICFCVLLFSFETAFAQTPDYHNGNGTIIKTENKNGNIDTFRKHIQKIFVSDETEKDRLTIYDRPDFSGKIVSEIQIKTNISIDQIVSKISSTKKCEIWLHVINYQKKNGWIFLIDGDLYQDPYRNNSWQYMETVLTEGEKWTTRKLEQGLAFWENVKAQKMPGKNQKDVLFII